MCDVTSLPLADHPVRWRHAVTTGDIAHRGLLLVSGGAVAAGTRAHALIALDRRELERRAIHGLESVDALHLLDALLSFPLGCPIALTDLTEREVRLLREAPAGCVEFDSQSVTRTLQVPATVVAAVVHGSRWRAALRRSAAFSPFTQRIVVLPTAPDASVALEAQIAGVGIWVDHGDDRVEDYLAPEPFVPNYFKAAGWRFAENAVREVLEASGIQRGVLVGLSTCEGCC